MRDAQYIGAGLVIDPGRFGVIAGPAFAELDSIHQRWDQRVVRVVNPWAALITARATTTSMTKGKPSGEHGLYTIAVARDADGSWRIVSVHKTTLPDSSKQ